MRKNILAILALLLIAFIVYHNWLLSALVTSGDWQFQFSKTLAEWLTGPFIWISTTEFGAINLGGLSGWPFYFFHGIFGHFGFDSGFSNKFVIFLPAIISSVVGSYFLIKKITGSIVGAAIGSLVFVYNTYFLIMAVGGGSWLLLIAFSLAPLALWLYISALEEGKASVSVLAGLVCFVVSFYEFRAFYILGGMLIAYWFYYCFVISKKISWLGLLPIIIVALLNSYWILGLAQSHAFFDNKIIKETIFGSSFMNLSQALTLFHPFWSGGTIIAFKIQPIPLYDFLIPIFAFMGFYVFRRDRVITFWAIMAIFGVLLSKQEAEPFSGLYRFLFNTVPGFSVFRESSKFYFLTAISYSVLIGAFVSWVWSKKSSLKYLAVVTIAAIFLWNTKSVITGEAGALSRSRKIPSDYLLVRDFLLKDSGFSRTLWVPDSFRFSFYSNIHPRVSFILSNETIWLGYSKYGDFTNGVPIEKQLAYLIKQPFFAKILDLSSIKYLMVPIQDIANNDDFYIYYGPRSYYLQSLEKLDYLKKINLGTKDVVVYENPNFRPHIYLTSELESPEKDIPLQTVNFTRISPTEYKIKLPKLSSPAYLNFTEAFHPEWRLKIGQLFLPDKGHTKSILGLNSFLIDPQTLKGRENVELTLYFRPQTWVNYGLIVSGGVLGITIFYLIFAYVFSKK